MIKRLIIFVVLIVISVSVSYSAPSISSINKAPIHGSSFVISGTDFGAHSDYNEGSFSWMSFSPICAKFKDFDDNSLTSGGWSFAVDNVNTDWTLSTTSGRTNSVYHGYRVCNNEALRYDALQYTMSKYDAAEQMFCSFWFRMGVGDGGKIWRIYGNAGNIYVGHDPGEGRQISGFSTIGGTAQWTSVDSYSNDGSWQRVDIWIDTATNTFTVFMDGVQQWTKSDWLSGDLDGDTHTLDIGHMIEAGDDTYEFDDIFVDYTQARVELCTGSTWAAKGACEIQPPTAWGTTSISLIANTGGTFSIDDTSYIYVVKSDGTVNSDGYETTISYSTPTISGCDINGCDIQ
jgi:hypothetical protein